MTERIVVPFQRTVSTHPEADHARVIDLRSMLKQATGAERLACLGELAELLRALGAFDESIDIATEAIKLAMSLGEERREASNTVRLATALQYAGRHVEADRVFAEAVARAEAGFVEYRPFLLQHWGKCLAEMDRYDDARSAFEEALRLRLALGREGYLNSTKRAIAGLDKRSVSSSPS